MTKRPRRNRAAAFKTKRWLGLRQGDDADRTGAAVRRHPNQITTGKATSRRHAGVFGQEKSKAEEAVVDLKGLCAKTGHLFLF